MSWTFRSNTEQHDFSFVVTINAGATFNFGFNSGTFAVGDLLVLEASAGGNSPLSFAITDDKGNVWNEVVVGGLDRGDGYRLGLWWAIAKTATLPTVGIKNTGANATSFFICQTVSWTPPAGTVIVDTVNPATGTSTAVVSPVVTNGLDELIVGFGINTVGFPTGSHTGSTTTTTFGTSYPVQYRNEAVAGTYSVGCDFGASAAFGCIGVSFKIVSGRAGSLMLQGVGT